MAENIEIKARARDWPAQLRSGRALADREELLVQADTFFGISNGRLKLREQKGKGAYLVFYRREAKKGPKSSVYTLVPVRSPARTGRALAGLLGIEKKVFKRRLVFHAGRTRIHFDEVRGLGRFIELEVVLKPGEPRARGEREAAALMKALSIRGADLLACAYADLL